MESGNEVRIVLLGKTGIGKSTAGNIILGQDEREPLPSGLCENTKKCQMRKRNIGSQEVVVVDTPGLLNREEIEEEMAELRTAITHHTSPHVFLLVLRLSVFQCQDQKVVRIIEQTFGKNTMAYTMVLFTHKNALKGYPIEKFIDDNAELKDLIIRCQWKYHLFNLDDQSPGQVMELMQKITKMIQMRGGSCYTERMLDEAKTALKVQQQQQKPQEQNKKEERAIKMSAFFGTGAGCVMGYFLSGGEMTSTVGAALGAIGVGIIGGLTAALIIKMQKCCKHSQ